MKLIEVNHIPEIGKTYVKIVGMKCDTCNREIKDKELWLDVCYTKNIYEALCHKHFCFDCAKDTMWDMWTKMQYTDFGKRVGYTDELFSCEPYDFERFGYLPIINREER